MSNPGQSTRWKLGNFEQRPAVGAFEPEPDEMDLLGTKHGLGVQKSWLYGFLKDAAGLTYGIERNFVGSLTSGLFIMTQDGDPDRELNVHPDCGRSARGELRRVLEGKTRRWSDPVFQRLPEACRPKGEQSMELEFSRERLAYGEGDILALEGESVGLGMQFFIPSLDKPLLYASTCFWVKGNIQGHEVEGPLWFDHSFWRHGVEWKEYGYFLDLQIMWHVFCNKFDDGSYEWGHLVSGRNGFSPGVVIQSNGDVALTSDTDAWFNLDETAWPTEATFEVEGSTYRMQAPVTGRMTEFSASRWAGYRAQVAQTRRDGDSRTLVAGFTWNEGFPVDRVGPDGKPA
jgi:hypothetical protein